MIHRLAGSWGHSRTQLARLQLLVCAAVLVPAFGCDRTDEFAEQRGHLADRVETADRSARSLLEQTAGAYARLERYSDHARVVLTYRLDGQVVQDVAPLAVAFERPNRLGMRAYQVQAGCDSDRFRLRLSSDSQSLLGKQVVSRSLPERLDMAWLMNDPVAAQHLSAGLGGSPPQLELLLGSQPFRGLITEQSTVTMDGQGIEHGRLFPIVKIAHASGNYRLWIDPNSSLLRRIELPTSGLPAEMRHDQSVTDIRLSIELDGVELQQPVEWAHWQVAVSPADQLVRYFTTPPESTVDTRLGKPIPAFQLRRLGESPGWLNSHEQAADGKLQVFVWLADHAASRTTLAQLESALRELPAEDRERVAPLAVWAEPQPPAGPSLKSLATGWEAAIPIVWDKQAAGRDVLAIREAPTIIILDSQHRLQFFHERAHPALSQLLPELLSALTHGEDIAARNNLQSQVAESRFRAQLWLSRASDCQLAAFTPAEPYPPATVQLSESERLTCDAPIAAMVADAAQDLWVLRHDGRVEQRDRLGHVQTIIDTQLKPRGAIIPRLAIDRQSRYLALPGAQPGTLQLVHLESKRVKTIALGQGQSITEYAWLATATGPRLGVITGGSRTVLIDPADDQQHSGLAPNLPVALLERDARDPAASGYAILADGSIEPILVQDQVGTGQTGSVQSEHGQVVSAQPISTAAALPKPAVAPQSRGSRRLSFTPSRGPWSRWQGLNQSATMARGRLADDEPALFMLDPQWNPMWHVPMPLGLDGETFLVAACAAAANQAPLWAVVQPQSTVHFMTMDGRMNDHCQFAEPIRGVALTVIDDQIHLWLAHPTNLMHYRLSVPEMAAGTANTPATH